MVVVSDVHAVEILDSRARPTLSITVTLADGTTARAGVPSGARSRSERVLPGRPLSRRSLSSDDMIERYADIVDRFPVWSIEDGLAESDWDGWERLNARLGEEVQLVGDDILVTNPEIIAKAIDRKVANAALIKVNQIGTVTETLEAISLCQRAGWAQMVSHRSGETTDGFIADLAIGAGSGQIKSGAPARGERVAKYNRLIEVEAADRSLPYGRPASR